MPRRKAAAKRVVLEDPLYGSTVITRFISVVMSHGKKSVAEKIVYGALEEILKRNKGKSKPDTQDDVSVEVGSKDTALELFKKAIDAIKPTVEVRSRRVGGATYQVPVEVRPDRKLALAMRWIVDAASARKERTMMLRLAHELLDALEGKGGSIKKREDMHKMAKANQAFAHYRW